MAVRIHQLAKELGIDNKELMELLATRGFAVKSVSSTIDNISADSLREEYKAKQQGAAPVAAPAEAAPVAAKPNIPAGAIVRSAEDVARERAARAEEAKAKAFAPVATTMPSVRPSAPPVVRMPTGPSAPPTPPQLSRPPAPPVSPAGFVRPAAPPSAPSLPPIVRLPQQNSSTPPAIVRPPVAAPTVPPIAKLPTPPPAITARPGQPTTPPMPVAPVATASAPAAPSGELRLMQIKPPIVVRDFALFLGQKPFKLISSLMEMGIFASMNQILEPELAIKVAERFGVLLEIKTRGEAPPAPPKKKEAPKVDEALLMETRSPVVCILGHVDHGKTTLIDYIRKTNVVAGEAGGITQHIGAYKITFKEKSITFLDTPGHSAFEKMRARGASLTDVAVLVVAADDGFKPQTEEALKHCRKVGVPIVVAITKTDVKGANIDRVKKQLQERNLLPEDWGGETIVVGVSAIKGEGIDTLLEMILLQADMLELKANPKASAEGIIVESKIEVGRGPTATVIVQKGTLKVGDVILCGEAYCKVRSMMDERDGRVDKAPPSTPVRMIGWNEAPAVGEKFVTVKNDREAKDMAEAVHAERLKQRNSQQASDLPTNAAELLAAITQQTTKTLSVVVKADVSGSLEAVVDAIGGIKSSKVNVVIIESSVGAITPGDVQRAHTAKAQIVAFSTRQENGVAALLKHHQVPVISHNIIYELVEQIRDAMAEMLDPIQEERSLGKAEIRKIFSLTKGTVAGSMVTEGSVFRDKLARVLRGKDVVGQGRITNLKRMKDDASEVKAGYECGISLGGVEDFKEGDIIECYEIRNVKPSL
jgi:translation initiation factor IF-2